MSDDLGSIKQNLERLETLFTSAMNKVNDRDETIKKKDAKISELTDKLMETSKDKENVLKTKMDLMETISKERDINHSENTKNQKIIAELREKLENTSAKKQYATDSMIGSGMTIDVLKKESDEKSKKIAELEERLGKLASGATGLFYDIPTTVTYLKKQISIANRSLRLVVPNIEFLKEHKLIELIEALTPNCTINIATVFDHVKDAEIIEKWKKRPIYLTDYIEQNLITVSANGADVGVALIQNNTVSGFYTNISDLVTIFNQALMHAFMKGKKI